MTAERSAAPGEPDRDDVIRDLVDRMRRILRDVQQSVDAKRQSLVALQKRLDDERAACELRHRKAVGVTQAERDDTQQAAAKLNAELDTLLGLARSHLLAQHTEIPTDVPDAEIAGGGGKEQTAAIAARALSRARALVRDVETTVRGSILETKGTNLFNEEGTGTTIAIGIGAFVIGIFVGIVARSFGAFALTTLLSFTIIALIVQTAHKRPLSDQYRAALGNAGAARSLLQRAVQIRNQLHDANAAQAGQVHQNETESAAGRYRTDLAALDQAARAAMQELGRAVAGFSADAGFAGYGWADPAWAHWTPSSQTAFAARFGRLVFNTGDLPDQLPSVPGLVAVPALAPLPTSSLLFKVTGKNKDRASRAVQALLARLVATIPPGKLRFTLIDPIGLGSNVAGIMQLGDFEDSLITSRAWTEPQHIDQRLLDLTEHMETVIQKYLRTDFKTIDEYNVAANEIAEPYRFVIVFDFPVSFSETAARRLLSIVRSGSRCGVHAVIVCDSAKPLPYGFSMAELERSATVIATADAKADGGLRYDDPAWSAWSVELDDPGPNELVARLIAQTGALAKDAMRVEVPYDNLLALAEVGPESWRTADTAVSLRVPLGRTGARKVQYLTLGEGMAHHALIVGRPGSGKSNLMHVIITTLALTYSPEQMRLYLIDFKKGVEFKPYADHRLPHAEAIAIESDREFALSVVERMDAELTRRGDLFRTSGAAGIADYRTKSGAALPRVLLVIDEFQEFFTQDDLLSRKASQYLDRLVRQGRAFGLHVMLGSQTLAGSYNLTRSTLDQMAVRIAMQCSDADSRLILADDNPAARLLSRPGEAIYNASTGLIDGNTLFQIARLTDEDREHALTRVDAAAADTAAKRPQPVIFEGNELAQIEACRPLQAFLAETAWTPRKSMDLLLGEPIAIRDPVAARLRRRSGSHLLLLARDEAEGLGMCVASLLSIVSQRAPDDVRIVVADFLLTDEDWPERFDEIAASFPHDVRVVRRQRDLAEAVRSIHAEMRRRIDAPPERASIVLLLQGLQTMRVLRGDDETYSYSDETRSPSALFTAILREGPEVGVHVVALCDTLSNAGRVVSRSALGEFGCRAGGAMSVDDSSSFFDDTAAGRIDKPHRALFADDERPGQLEKFRPYAIPDRSWLQGVARGLHARLSKADAGGHGGI